MKLARRSWHTRQNCMIRSRIEAVRRSIHNSLKRFVGQPITTEAREEMATRIRQCFNAVAYPSIKVTRSEIDGDMLNVEFEWTPSIRSLTFLPELAP